MQKYGLQINLPGIAGFDKRNEPIANPPIVEEFTANSHTEARNIAARKYEKTGLKQTGSYNVSIA